MSLKTITHPVTGKHFKMGRKRPVPVPGRRKLRFHDYKLAGLPTPPASSHYSYKAEPAISQMYKNDELSCCVVAAPLHAIGVFTANAGEPTAIFTDEQVVDLYGLIGGYKPGDPSTDNGCDEQTMLQIWQTQGLLGHKIQGWLSVRATDAKQAIWLFENLITGINLPEAWVSPMPGRSNFVWDVAGDPVPDNGHAMYGNSFNPNGTMWNTWGMNGLMTDAALAKYTTPEAGGELYTVLTDEIIAKATAKAPSGFAWSELQKDFQTLSAA